MVRTHCQHLERRQFAYRPVTCSDHYQPERAGCHPKFCSRQVYDDFITQKEVLLLKQIADKGMEGTVNGESIAARTALLDMRSDESAGGPCIMDVNSGFVRDSSGLRNIYRSKPAVKFSMDEYAAYESVFTKIKQRIMDIYGLENLFFTSPTFMYVFLLCTRR